MKAPKPFILPVALAALLATGCQTFSLTEEDFAKQQRGEMVDSGVGEAVGIVGSLSYLGAMIGAAIAGVK